MRVMSVMLLRLMMLRLLLVMMGEMSTHVVMVLHLYVFLKVLGAKNW